MLMHFLLLDTADARGCVAVFQDAGLLTVSPHPSGEDFSSWLLPAVHRALAEQGLSLLKLDGYAVCSGPGSFTGLRVGLTTAKAWAEIFGKPIAAVSRLEALARSTGASSRPRTPFTAVFSDARRGQVFAVLCNDSGTPIEPESVVALEIFLRRADAICGTAPILWKTPDPHLLQSLPAWAPRAARGDAIEPIEPPFAVQLGALAQQKFLKGQTTDALALDANYVRRSDAELFWTENRSAIVKS
jgi:tRNA threonylcarbamoyladenosine biosynthesis protein TsaB